MTQLSQQSGAAAAHHAPLPSPKAAAGAPAELDQRLDIALFKALADPTRARLLACLLKCPRPCTVTEVAECCSVDFSVVARHLALLAGAGLLDSEKRGRTMWYTARGEELCGRLRGLAAAIEAWCPCQDESCCPAAPAGDADSACCNGGACDA